MIQPIESLTSQYSSVPRLKTFTLSATHRLKHRVDAVLHIKIGLALPAIAEDVQAARVGQQLLVEVEHVAMGVAFAQDRDKAKNPGAHAEPFAIGRDQALAREFRGAVERGLDRKRRILRGWDDLGLAIDRAGRGEGDVGRRWRAWPRAH